MSNNYLKTKSRSPLVYFLNEEDVQNIAKEKFGRNLTHLEVKKIIEPINENIDWDAAISIAIEQNLEIPQIISG